MIFNNFLMAQKHHVPKNNNQNRPYMCVCVMCHEKDRVAHHAPPGRHAVRGGPRRGGDDEAVRLDGGKVLLVAVALQVCQVRAGTCRGARAGGVARAFTCFLRPGFNKVVHASQPRRKKKQDEGQKKSKAGIGL